jgi:hypothetical protein
MEQRMFKHHRFTPITPLEQRLAEEAKQLRAEAETLPCGQKRDGLLRKARQDEVAAHLNEWLNSPGLRAPI